MQRKETFNPVEEGATTKITPEAKETTTRVSYYYPNTMNSFLLQQTLD
jgi:hypothetical protein